MIVTGRMFRSVKRYLDEARARRAGRLLPGRGRADPQSGDFLRHVPIPLERRAEAIAAVAAEGYHLNCYVDDELYVAEVTPRRGAYADFQGLPIHPVGDLLAWLDRPPTKLVVVGEPASWTGSSPPEGAVRRSPLHLEVAPVLPRARGARRDEGGGLAFVAEQLGFCRSSGPSRSATARTTSSCSSGSATRWRSRTRTSACSRSPTSSARAPRRRAWRRCSRPLLDSRA